MLIQFAGIQLHLYGLIVGIAAAVGVLLGEKIVEAYEEYKQWYWQAVGAIFFGGFIGARLYHVWTDWALYAENLSGIFMIWKGGLSILGAILGGAVGICVLLHLKKRTLGTDLFFWLDLSVLCLPISQAIGRIGNFVNQELYGLPTTLPWAIFIEPEYRVRGYGGYSHYHPLFAYEALGLLALAAVFWFLWKKKKWSLGTGNFFWAYLGFYGIFRGLLEFLRLEKSFFFQTGLGLNQVILFGLGVVGIAMLVKKGVTTKFATVAAVLCIASSVFAACQVQPSSPRLSELGDHSVHAFQLMQNASREKRQLNLEIVNTPKSIEEGLSGREQIGSDGMLFVFPSAAQYTFWMPRMKFDLDIIWLLEGKVVGILEDVPRPESETQDLSTLPKYQSPEFVDTVLEVPAGTANTWQLREGDALELL